MASKTCGRPCRVHAGASAGPSGSTAFRSESPFLGDPDKLAGNQAPPSGRLNVLAAAPKAFAAPKAPPVSTRRVYSSEEVQNIIRTVM